MLILALSCLAATRSYSMFALMSARMIGARRMAPSNNWHCRRAAGAAAPAGAGHGDHFGGVSAAKRSGVPLAGFIATYGGLATRLSDGLAVTGRRCVAVLDAARAVNRPYPRSGCAFIVISSAIPLLGGQRWRHGLHHYRSPPSPTFEPLLINLRESRRPLSPACCCCQGVSGLLGNDYRG